MHCGNLFSVIWAHTKNIRVWFHGLAAAIVGGTSSTLGAHFVDPAKVDFSPEGMKAIWRVALAGAFLTAVAYFAKSPLPQICPDEKPKL